MTDLPSAEASLTGLPSAEVPLPSLTRRPPLPASRPGGSPAGERQAALLALSLTLVLTSGACRAPLREAPEETGRPVAEARARSWARLLRPDSAFGRLVARLSEPGGYFDTDNLISNERSYLHVVGALRRLGVRGGAYIGVGPDQNFSYLAAVRPDVAFIVDLRRDNLLEQLMFKALFAASRSRMEYLCLWVGRRCPEDLAGWESGGIEELVEYLDGVPEDPAAAAAAREAVLSRVGRFGIPLSEEDRATVARFHDAFIGQGLDLRFASHGRAPRFYYPTLRQLLLERDLEGRPAGYLGAEQAFRFVKRMSDENRIVPVVGDLADRHALAQIGRLLAERGEMVSAFYTSNVEFYLVRQGSFDAFVQNLAGLPHDARSVIIRSYFGGAFGRPHPAQRPGYASAQLLQGIERLEEAYGRGEIRGYYGLVTHDAVPLAPAAGGR